MTAKLKKPRLLNEGGITQTSLKNNRRLTKRLGSPVRVELHYDPNGAEWYRAVAMYSNGDKHTFTGFAWGYSGEGPRGLLEFCQYHDIPLTSQEIHGLDNRMKAMTWVWPTGGAFCVKSAGVPCIGQGDL